MRNANDYIVSPKNNNNIINSDKNYTIILFSESYGYRMKNHGAVQLTKINDRPLIDHQINAIKSTFSNFKILISCGFESNRIWKHIKSKFNRLDITLIENPLFKTTNSCESVRLALMSTGCDNVLLCSSSNVFEKKHLDQLNYSKSSTFYQKIEDNKCDLKLYKDRIYCSKIDFGVGDLSWVEMVYLKGQKSIEDLFAIIDSEDYKNKFLFEALNKLSTKHLIETYQNKHKEIVKLDSALKLKGINK
tara:strand:+ start:98 stop:838 length:741 start_codon:yes stop_codon:yes gene_type:complete